MTASYPSSVRVYTNKVDLSDVIVANDVNTAYEEIIAIENTLGAGILSSTWTGSFSQVTTSASVNARLINIERGILGDTHTQYVKKTGDSITLSNPNANGLVVTGAASQISNIVVFRNSAGTGFSLTPDGTLYANGAVNFNSTITMNLAGAPGGSTYQYAYFNNSTNRLYYGATVSSSKVVKRNIRKAIASEVSSIIDSVEPVTFQYKKKAVKVAAEANRVRYGFIAEQLAETAMAHAVDRDEDGTPIDVDSRQLVAVLWAEVQDLRKRLARLEAV